MANESNVDVTIKARDLTKEAFAAVQKALKELENQAEQTSGKSSGIADAIGKFFQKPIDLGDLAKGALLGVAGAVAAVTAATIALGSHGADVVDVEAHFKRLNEEIGNNSAQALKTLQDATGHTISNFDLMKTANVGLADGLKLTNDDLGVIGRASRVVADQMGGDTKDAFDELFRSMETGKSKALGLIGVQADQKKALEDYSKVIHKSVEDFTKHDEIMATQTQVLKGLRAMLKDTGDAQDDFADAVSRGKTTLTNFTDDLSVGVANSKVFAAAIGSGQQALDAAFGGQQSALITAIVHLLEQCAIRAIDFAQAGLSVAGVLGQAFGVVQITFDVIAGALLKLGQTSAQVVAGVLDLASHMPGAGDKLKGVAAAAHDTATQLGGMADSFKDQAKEALETVKGNSAYQKTLDGVGKGLQTVRDAMVHASQAQGEATDATDAATAASKRHTNQLGDQNRETKAAQEAAKKHAEEIKKLGEAMSGAGVLKAIADMNEALHKEGVTLTQMPVDALKKLNDAVAAGIDLYRRRGQAAPEALHVEALAIKAALDQARRAQEDFDKLHGPTSPIGFENLAKGVPEAKLANGDPMESSLWQTQATLASHSMVHAFETAIGTVDMAGVQKAAQKRIHDALSGVSKFDITLSFVAQLASQAGPAGQTIAGFAGNMLAAHEAADKFNGSAGVASALFAKNATSADRWSAAMQSGSAIVGGAMDVWNSTTSTATKSVNALHGAVAGAKAGAAFGPWGMAVGAAAGAVVGFVKSLNAGRNSVKEFAESMGGFDALHEQLAKLGDAGEQMWIKLTQGTPKGDPKAAQAEIEKIQKALANIPPSMADLAAQAGYQTQASLESTAQSAVKLWQYMKDAGTFTAASVADAWQKAQDALAVAGDLGLDSLNKAKDAAQKVLDDLDGQIKSLQQSVDAEAPEEVMGVIEAQQRAQLEALRKQRDEAQKNVDSIDNQIKDAVAAAVAGAQSAAQDAGKATVDAIKDALDHADFRVSVKADLTGAGTGSDDGMPAHADGAYIRDDHVAHVHSGELIGPVEFMSNALAGALARVGGAGGGPERVVLQVDGRTLTEVVLRHQSRVLAGYGAGGR